jgi:hypothetical protein
MMERIRKTSLQFEARIAGVLYLLTILTGIFAGGFVSGIRKSNQENIQ